MIRIRTRLRAVAKRSGQVALVALAMFALAEFTVRGLHLVAPSLLPAVVFHDPSYNRFRGRPGALDFGVPLNSGGFRDAEFEVERHPGLRRVVAIGDSFAFGAVPYEDNFLTRAETLLLGRGAATEILNMGIPGMAPQDYLALLAREGLALQPDLVLLSFFVGNDFDETMRVRTRIGRASKFIALSRFVIGTRLALDRRVYNESRPYDDDEAFFRESTYFNIQRQRSWIFRRPPLYPKAMTDAISYLVEMRDLCRAQGAAFMIVVVPDEMQVDPVIQKQVTAAIGLSADELDFSQPNRFLREQFDRHSLDAVDLLDAFVAEGAHRRLYKPLDTHWNRAGNALAATIVADALAARLGW